MTEGQPYRAECVCGKKVTITKKGAPRAHACTNPGGPGWPEDAAPAQPVVPADVEETEIFDKPVDPTKVRDGRLTPAGNNAPGDFFAKYRVMEGVTGFPLACGHTAKGRDVVRARTDVHDTYECEGGCNGDREPKPTMRELIDQMSPESPARLTGGADDTASHASGVPLDAVEKGAWFGAMYAGGIACGHRVEEGDLIRADGEGGFECEEFCGQDDPAPHIHWFKYMDDGNGHSGVFCHCGEPDPENWNGTGQPRPSATTVPLPDPEPVKAAPRLLDTLRAALRDPFPPPQAAPRLLDTLREAQASLAASGGGLVTTDLFTAPATVAMGEAFPTPGSTPAPAADSFSASATVAETWQQTDSKGYRLKDPQTGDFRRYKNGNIRSITRTTTFNKAASDRTALNDWGKRNVLVGATRRPDLVLKAHGLDVSADKQALDQIVNDLETAASAKVAADVGSAVHKLTEDLDGGLVTVDSIPLAYQAHVESYRRALEEAGLRVVPSLIEGTVFTEMHGGIAGKFDRILYHVASGTYLMGDLKTGKNMSYGWDEIECQEYIYVTGYNRWGTYDWGTHAWKDPEYQVRTDVGVVMWLPVQGPTAGQCQLLKTDLARGARVAQLCADVREGRKAKGKPVAWSLPAEPVGVPQQQQARRTWEDVFAEVRSGEHAAQLWQEAHDAGVTGERMDRLVEIARRRLTN